LEEFHAWDLQKKLELAMKMPALYRSIACGVNTATGHNVQKVVEEEHSFKLEQL